MNPLQENYYQNLLSDLDDYSRLVSADVVRIICERLKKVGELNPTSVRQIITMTKEMDIDLRAIKKAIAKRMGMTLKEVDRVFDQAAMDSAELAMALAKDQAGIVNMNGIKRLARAAANKCKEMILNLSDTFGFKLGKQNLSIRNAYIAVVNKATLAVQTGALDYDTAIREEVKRLSDAGISVVQWESGYRRRLDSSIRMNVMEGVRQMNQEVLNEAGEKFADGVEISAHDRPAPDHADIQGKQFTKEEYEKLNASLKRPIGTLNCMHIAFPIIYGVTEPGYTDEELRTMKKNANKKYIWKGKELNGYECTQKQREYETEIRKEQDREKALRAAGDKEGADREHKRAVDLRKEYRAFSEHVGLKEKLNRTGRTGKTTKTKKTVFTGSNQQLLSSRQMTEPHVEKKMVYTENGNTYEVDGRRVRMNHIPREEHVGEILSALRGETVYLLPEVSYPKHVSLADYLTESGIKFDRKGIEGNGKNTLSSIIQDMERQSHNFIFDITDKCKLTDDEINSQITRIYCNRRTSFVDTIIVIRGETVVFEYHR